MPDYEQKTREAREEARKEQDDLQEELAAIVAAVALYWSGQEMSETVLAEGVRRIRVQVQVALRRRRKRGATILRRAVPDVDTITVNPQRRRGVAGVPSLVEKAIQRHLPDLQARVTGGASGRDLATALVRGHQQLIGRVAAQGTSLSDASPSGLYSDLKRTVATELISAIDEAEKELYAQSDSVGVVEWQVSARHDSLESSPDVCDVLATQDLYGLGAGRYPPSVVPSHPHPWCECSVRPILTDAAPDVSPEAIPRSDV